MRLPRGSGDRRQPTRTTFWRRTDTSLIDVLDRVLDKGIVIDAWVRVSLVGIDLITRRGAVELSPELYQTLMRRFTLPWRRARRVRTA